MAASEKLGSNFWRQLVATGVSNIGDGMVHAAAPLLTLSLTDDPRLIAGVSFSSMLPWLVLTLPAGVYIDRFNRQRLMIAANVIRAALYALIAVAAATDSLNIWTFMLVLLGVGGYFGYMYTKKSPAPFKNEPTMVTQPQPVTKKSLPTFKKFE